MVPQKRAAASGNRVVTESANRHGYPAKRTIAPEWRDENGH
jgi:hypothetical protein